jgi:hypothetical protein
MQSTGMMLRAWSDWDSASAQEQHIAALFLMNCINHMQTMYFMWESKAIDGSVYFAEEDFACAILSTNGGGKWWEMVQEGFVEGFRNRINKKLESGKYVSVTDSVPYWNAIDWPRPE